MPPTDNTIADWLIAITRIKVFSAIFLHSLSKYVLRPIAGTTEPFKYFARRFFLGLSAFIGNGALLNRRCSDLLIDCLNT